MQDTAVCETGKTWHNWGGNLTANPASLCKPQSRDDLPVILQKAKSEGKTVRVLGGGYSWTPVVPTDGYIIDMSALNKLISVDKARNRITVEAGMNILNLSTIHAKENGLSFQTETVIPWITAGGAVALGCHGTGYHMGTVSDEVAAMEMLLADGTWRTFSVETDGEDMMNAVRVNLGALGIIYSVTFQCVPSFNLKAVDVRKPMQQTIGEIGNLVTGHDYVEVFWFPFNEDCWIKTWDKTDEPPTEGEPKWGWDELKEYLEINSFGKLLMDLLHSLPWLTPWVMRRFSNLMPEQTVVAHSSLIFHYQLFYMPVWDMSYCINIPNNDFTLVQKAWMQVVKRIEALKKQGKYPQNMVLHTRYIRNSNALLSPASGEDHTCCIEILTFTGDNRPVSDYEDYFKQIEQDWIELGGKPHWGKAIYSVDKLKGMYGANMDAFLNLRQQFDPDQIFINDFLRQVFQLPQK
jgi:hypothetical protein